MQNHTPTSGCAIAWIGLVRKSLASRISLWVVLCVVVILTITAVLGNYYVSKSIKLEESVKANGILYIVGQRLNTEPRNFSLGPDPRLKFWLVDRVLTKGKTGTGARAVSSCGGGKIGVLKTILTRPFHSQTLTKNTSPEMLGMSGKFYIFARWCHKGTKHINP